MAQKSNRGLSSSDKETRERVAREGRKAPHGNRRQDDEEDGSWLGMRR